MTIDTTLMKRRALYRGEVGFFPSNEVSQRAIEPITMDTESMHKISTDPRKVEALRFVWALVDKTAENTDRFTDKDDLMEALKIAAGFCRYVVGKDGLEQRGKSLTGISAPRLHSLTDKFIDIICREIIPDMKPNVLRKEIEEMCKVTTHG